ncbi:MAG TPA: hypothetical protein VK636_04705 [Gemmatimonadaceae bacterium]|nr:hypothetical protein [Gemmatimonadaceae bacterium]
MRRSMTTLCLAVTAIGCGKVGGAATRGAERGMARAIERDIGRVWERDAARDAKLVAKPLGKGRTVFRYTTAEQAAMEARGGVQAGSHFTARGGPGRPLSANVARGRLGLDHLPEVRETIRLPAGQSVKAGKVIGGARGVGELTPTAHVPGSAIKRVLRIPPK